MFSLKNSFKKNKKGIVLITTMLLLTIIVMIATLLALSAHNGLQLGKSYNDAEKAQYAALSGLEYARSRIYKNAEWMQNTAKSEESIYLCSNSQSPLIINEGKGIVEGYINDSDSNNKAMFRIVFVSPDKAHIESPDELANLMNGRKLQLKNSEENTDIDKSYKRTIDYISCNNVARTGSYNIFKKNRETNNFEVYKKDLPANTIYLVSQGVSNGTVRYAESFINVADIKNFSTSSIARGNINVGLVGANPSLLINARTQESTSLRAYGNIEVGSVAENKNCFVLANDGYAYGKKIKINNKELTNSLASSYGINIDTSENSLAMTNEMLESGKDINWSTLTTNSSADGLSPGAYLYNLSDEKWYHCEEAIISGLRKETISIGFTPPKPISNTNHNGINFADLKLELNGNIACRGNLIFAAVDVGNLPAKSNQDINISGLKRLNINFNENATLEVGGPNKSADLILQGELTGTGKIYSKGSVYFQGGSFFDTQKNNGVSVYAEENVEILPSTTTQYTDTVNEYLQTVWTSFADYANEQQFESEAVAAKKLLEKEYTFKGAKTTLAKQLTALGCKDEREQQLFAEMVLSKNSAIVGGDIDASTPPTGFLQILPQSMSDISNYVPTEFAKADPYKPGYFGSDGYKWERNYDNNGISISVNFRTDEFEKLNSTTKVGGNYVLNKDTVNSEGGYIEIWIHQAKAVMDPSPNDLFIYIPINQNDKIYAKFGQGRIFDKTNPDNPNSCYNQETHLILNQQGVTEAEVNENGLSYKINLPLIVNGLISLAPEISYKAEPYNILHNGKDRVNYKSSNASEVLPILNEFREALKGFEYTKKAFTNASPNVNDFVAKINANSSLQLGCITGDPDTIVGSGKKQHLVLKETLKENVLPGVNDTIVRGMIFVKNGNFSADAGKGSLTVVGGIVAYGKDENDNINHKGGNISITNAGAFNLCYDPDYMHFFYGQRVITQYVFRAVL